MELDDVTKEDAGKYACIAQNQLGEASSSAWLIIEGTYMIPSRLGGVTALRSLPVQRVPGSIST